MRLRPIPPLLFATALLFGTIAMTANAQTSATAAPMQAGNTLLSVSAQADATRTPDVATLSTGVVTQAADANAALRANAVQMEKVIATIKASGVADRDVQTSGIGVSPQYKYTDDQPPAITGYQASNTVNVKIRDITKVGKVLDALVAGGANQVNGPSFEIDEPEAVYDEARRAALEKAQSRATMYAKSLGMQVRRIVSISEGGGFVRPQPMMMMTTGSRAKAADTSVSPGETSLSANLDVVFELGR